MFIQGILDIGGFEIHWFHKLAVFKSSIFPEPLFSFLIYANIWKKNAFFFTWSLPNSTKYALDWIFKRNPSYKHSIFASQVHPRFDIAYRGLVRTGATGASAPSEIWQRVHHTCPEERVLVSKTVEFSKKCKNSTYW